MARSKRKPQATELVPAEPEAHGRGSIVNITIGNRHLPAIMDITCAVCTHPGRAQIEERLLYNDPYVVVADWVSERKAETIDGTEITWPKINVWQLARHYDNNHCPVDTRVLHELSEQHMRELGTSYEEHTTRVVDHVVTLKTVAHLGNERLMRGEITPNVKETIEASKAVAQIEYAHRQVEQTDHTEQYEQAMEIYFQAAQQVMTPEQWREFGVLLSGNPVLARLSGSDDETVDAEIVEEA